MKKIIIDAFGCDNPDAIIKGTAQCLSSAEDVSIVLCGDREYIENELSAYEYDKERLEILHAPQIITNHDDPRQALLQKRDSSIVAGMKRLKEDDECIGMITAGSTGAAILSSAVYLGRLPGVESPALATHMPSKKDGHYVIMLDCGAAVDVPAEQMKQFALLGSALSESFVGVENPRVAVVSVGTEDEKGSAFSKKVFTYLKEMPINFVGNMEARDALSGNYDVLVCDGFAGNVLLKGTEGAAMFVVEKFIAALKKNLPEGVDGSFIKKAAGELLTQIDLTSNGGATILGTIKPIIKAHGNSNERSVLSCVRQLLKIHDGGYVERAAKLFEKI